MGQLKNRKQAKRIPNIDFLNFVIISQSNDFLEDLTHVLLTYELAVTWRGAKGVVGGLVKKQCSLV